MKWFCLGLTAFFVISFSTHSAAQSIVSIEEDGHKVFTNADGQASRSARLMYWSSVEHRWKAVPARGSATMKQAESAMADVMENVQRQLAMPRENSRDRVSPANLDALIEEAAARHQVDANLVRAVVKVESNFNPNAISPKGAMGLMQLMPQTARQLNVSNPFDPQQNVDAGVRHLKSLLETNSGDVARSLAAYNAGQGAVQRNNGIPPYAETRNYVRQITHLYSSSSGTARTPLTNSAASWTSIAKPLKIARDIDGAATFTNVY